MYNILTSKEDIGRIDLAARYTIIQHLISKKRCTVSPVNNRVSKDIGEMAIQTEYNMRSYLTT